MHSGGPTRNPTAVAAYYTGIFALFPGTGLIMGPAALWLGVRALKAIRRDPILPGNSHTLAALVLGGLTTVLNWGFLIWMVVDRFAK